jgi:hypothetical protein
MAHKQEFELHARRWNQNWRAILTSADSSDWTPMCPRATRTSV